MFEYTFKDSERTASFKRISFTTFSLMYAHWTSENPEPQIPLKDFPDGIGGVTKEEDSNDKAYLKAKDAWNKRYLEARELLSRKLYAQIGMTSEPDLDAVSELTTAIPYLPQQLRDEFSENKVTLEDAVLNRYLYLWSICVTTPEDYQDFLKVMTQRSQPTKPVVTAVAETFQGAVPSI